MSYYTANCEVCKREIKHLNMYGMGTCPQCGFHRNPMSDDFKKEVQEHRVAYFGPALGSKENAQAEEETREMPQETTQERLDREGRKILIEAVESRIRSIKEELHIAERELRKLRGERQERKG